MVMDPTQRELQTSNSAHVFTFTAKGGLLLAESQGDFTMAEWEEACSAAKKICCEASAKAGMDMVLDDEERPGPDMQQFIRDVVEERSSEAVDWK